MRYTLKNKEREKKKVMVEKRVSGGKKNVAE